MTLMLAKLYDALRASGAPDEKALAAAEEVAGYEREIGSLRTEARVGQGLTGVLIVVGLAALWQLFAMRGEVGELRAGLTDVREGLAEARGGLEELHGEVAALRQSHDQLRRDIQATLAAIERRLAPTTP